jgi:LysM repeat protein
MSKSKDNRDQAQLLRNRMNTNTEEENSSIDMLELPPRSRVHKVKDEKKKTKVKLKYPMVRFLALLFVLLPIAILGYTYYQNNQPPAANMVSNNQNESPYKEEISLDSSNGEKVKANKAVESVKEENDENNNEDDRQVGEEETTENTSEPQGGQPSSSPETNEDNYDIVFHTVKNGDTLYSISQHYYNSRSGEELIKKWNGLKSNKVENGKVLKIPVTPSK